MSLDTPSRDLPRAFGFWTGLFVVAASMIGSAVLSISGPIAAQTGSNRIMLVLWLFGGGLSLAGALPLAEMATAYPRVGGDYFFIQKAFGPALGFVYGWATVLCGFAAPIAAVSSFAASLLYSPLRSLVGDARWPEAADPARFTIAVGTALIAGFSWAHCRGHRDSSWLHNAATLFKIGVLVLFTIALGCSDRASFANVAASSGVPVQWPTIGNSLVLIMYAYVGWNGAVYLAGEIRDPGRLLPRCVVGGCVAVTALYLAINFGYALVANPESLAKLDRDAQGKVAKAVATMAFDAPTADRYMTLIGLGVLASLSAFVLSGARVVFALARDGLFPGWAGALSARNGAPIAATVTQGGLAIVCLWSGTFEALQNYAGFGLGVLASLSIAAIFWLRRLPDYAPAFRIPGYPTIPLVFVGVNLAMLAASAFAEPIPAAVSATSMALGFPVYFACRPLMRIK